MTVEGGPVAARLRALAARVRTRAQGYADVERLTTYTFALTRKTISQRSDGIVLVRASEPLLLRMKEQNPRALTARKLAILQARLSSPNETCFLVQDGQGALMGYCHSAVSTVLNARIHYQVRLDDTEVYFYDDHVFPQHRRRGLHRLSITERCRIAYEQGYRVGVTIISDGNAASVCSYRAFGARPRRLLAYFPGMGRTLSLPLGTPWLHLPDVACA